MSTLKRIVLVTCLLMAGSSFADRTLIHAGKLIDVVAGKALTQRTLIVEGDRIGAILVGYAEPIEGDVVIDLKQSTVMPGWIDMHVHIASELSPKSYEQRFQLDGPDKAFRSAVYARRTLMAGFTTVRDLGTSDSVAIALRKAIKGG